MPNTTVQAPADEIQTETADYADYMELLEVGWQAVSAIRVAIHAKDAGNIQLARDLRRFALQQLIAGSLWDPDLIDRFERRLDSLGDLSA